MATKKKRIRRAKDAASLRAGVRHAKEDVKFTATYGIAPYREFSNRALDDTLYLEAYKRTMKHEMVRYLRTVADRIMERAKEITGEEIPPYVQAARDQLDATIAKSLGHRQGDDLEKLL